MKSKLLFILFMISVIVLLLTGFYTFKSSEQLIALFEKQGQQFSIIANAAAQVVSYSKRAEGHLHLYLMLHDPVDKEKFPERIKSLFENISIIEKNTKNPKTRIEIDNISTKADELLSIGNELIVRHDQSMRNHGEFKIETCRQTILKLHDRLSGIRNLGVKLAAILINSEDELKAEAQVKARRLQTLLLLLAVVAACFAGYAGYALAKSISTLNREIAVRKESEARLQAETEKLNEALSKIKTLNGLIPICASCKKIRDDEGYWNQLEAYITKHSDAKLTHGLCPECAKKLYAEFMPEKK